MTPALDVFQQLRDRGVVLTPYPDGTIRYKAPHGVMTPELVASMRQHKAELQDLLEEYEERAGIMEFCGGLPREAAEQLAWQVLCNSEAVEV